jgi:hypothetical protein
MSNVSCRAFGGLAPGSGQAHHNGTLSKFRAERTVDDAPPSAKKMENSQALAKMRPKQPFPALIPRTTYAASIGARSNCFFDRDGDLSVCPVGVFGRWRFAAVSNARSRNDPQSGDE